MSRQDRWCEGANDIVIDAWRYARRLGRTAAERIAVFNVEMERLERQGARAVRALRKSGDFHQSRNGVPAVETPELRTCRAQLLRWHRLSHLSNETTVSHGHGTPPAGVKRWV